jgi:hypothetical protein
MCGAASASLMKGSVGMLDPIPDITLILGEGASRLGSATTGFFTSGGGRTLNSLVPGGGAPDRTLGRPFLRRWAVWLLFDEKARTRTAHGVFVFLLGEHS